MFKKSPKQTPQELISRVFSRVKGTVLPCLVGIYVWDYLPKAYFFKNMFRAKVLNLIRKSQLWCQSGNLAHKSCTDFTAAYVKFRAFQAGLRWQERKSV